MKLVKVISSIFTREIFYKYPNSTSTEKRFDEKTNVVRVIFPGGLVLAVISGHDIIMANHRGRIPLVFFKISTPSFIFQHILKVSKHCNAYLYKEGGKIGINEVLTHSNCNVGIRMKGEEVLMETEYTPSPDDWKKFFMDLESRRHYTRTRDLCNHGGWPKKLVLYIFTYESVFRKIMGYELQDPPLDLENDEFYSKLWKPHVYKPIYRLFREVSSKCGYEFPSKELIYGQD